MDFHGDSFGKLTKCSEYRKALQLVKRMGWYIDVWRSALGNKSGLILRYGMVIILPGIPCGMYMCIYGPIHHYGDVIMGAIASQITSLTIVYATVYSDADQIKHQSSASLAFVWGIHRSPVNSPHKWPVTRKMFPFDDVIMRVLL